MASTRKVEGRLAIHLEVDRSTDDTDAANQPVEIVALARLTDRHVVRHFANSIGIQKTRNQDICRGPVELLLTRAVRWRNLKVVRPFLSSRMRPKTLGESK